MRQHAERHRCETAHDAAIPAAAGPRVHCCDHRLSRAPPRLKTSRSDHEPSGAGEFCQMLDHVAVQCADVAASAAFYDSVLAPLGATRVMDFATVIASAPPPFPPFSVL